MMIIACFFLVEETFTQHSLISSHEFKTDYSMNSFVRAVKVSLQTKTGYLERSGGYAVLS